MDNINIDSKEKCLDILKENIQESKQPAYQYVIYQAASYYCRNFEKFSAQETQEVLSNSIAFKKLQGALFKQFLQKANKENRLIPDKLVTYDVLNRQNDKAFEEYVRVINRFNSPQIKIAYEVDKNVVENEFINGPAFGENQSSELVNIIMEKNPDLWAHNLTWSDEQLIDVIKNNKSQLKNFILKSFEDCAPRTKSKKIKHAVWDIVIANSMTSIGTMGLFPEYAKACGVEFLKYAKEKDSKLVAQELKYINIYNRENFITQMFEKQENIQELSHILKDFRHLIVKPQTKSYGLYEDLISPFKLSLESKSYIAFYLYADDIHELNEEEKDCYAAACFNALLSKHDGNKNWIIKSLTTMEENLIQKYAQKAKNKMGTEEFKMLESLILYRNLDKNLPDESEVKTKKLKI